MNIIFAMGYRFSLSAAVREALRLLQPRLAEHKRRPADRAAEEQVLEFFRGRLKALWSETYRPDAVEAVLSAGFDDLFAAQRRVQALCELLLRPDFLPLAVTFKRVANIVEKQGRDLAGSVDRNLLNEEAERALHRRTNEAAEAVRRDVERDDYAAALRQIAGLKPVVDAF